MSKDKLLHLAMGAVAGVITIVLVLLAVNVGLPAAIVAAGAAVGIGYEAQQHYRKEGTVEVADALATTAGAALVAIVVTVAGFAVSVH